MAHLRLGEHRDEGTANVHVFNPDLAASGWQSAHTVVQIVTDDMPFLVDSVRMVMTAMGLGIHLVIHPMLRVRREECRYRGCEAGTANEAWIYLEVDRCDGVRQEALRQRLLVSLDDVRVAVADWRTMRDRCRELVHELEHSVLAVGAGEAARAAQFLRWLSDDHFVFLGFREYEFLPDLDDGATAEEIVSVVPGTGLGLLRDGRRTEDPHHLSALTPEARRMVFSPSVLMLTTANSRSTVFRADYLAYIGVKRFDHDGRVVGERRFLGLYNSDVYRDSVLEIPLLRDKAAEVLDRAGFGPESHSGRALRQILETYPRNELLQINVDELFEIASGILELQDRRQVRLFRRRDDYGRFISCLVYLPRDRYSTDRAEQIAEALREAYGGTGTEHEVLIGMGALARLYVRVALGPEVRDPVIADVEQRLGAIVADWADELGAALVGELGEDAGLSALARFAQAFPADYRDAYSPATAAADVSRLMRIEAGADLITALHRPLGAPPEEVRFTLMRPGAPLVLSEVLPLLEDLGVTVVDERPHEIRVDGQSVWRYDIGLRVRDPDRIDERAVRDEFCATFAELYRGTLESDGLNELVLVAGLTARQVDVLRAYAKYLRQVGLSFSQRYVEETVARHGSIVNELILLFETRFDPTLDDPAGGVQADGADRPGRLADLAAITASINDRLDAVPSLDEDRILRSFLTLIQATQRTNAYRPLRDGDPSSGPRPVLSFKFDPEMIPDLPLPRPMFEIWVYSPRVEGVHLRGGAVARGGLRWSDRREDFRTEVLGLMKAQMVKNAVIIPVGAKGGFVVKRREQIADPDVLRREVADCYRAFVAGLLDVTDNVVDGAVVPPPAVVRHDGDDPYLVVAADKGTATFSDLANEVAASYGFWLGDAFASGGSVGYDHKAMGITARGAWESAPAPRPLARTRCRHRPAHRGRGRRHVGRRLRQRASAQPPPPPGRRVRPSPHLHGSRPRPGPVVPGAAAPLRAAPLELGRLRPHPDLSRGRRLAPLGQVDRALGGGPARPRLPCRHGDAQRAALRHPEGARRPALERRDRYLRQGLDGEQRRGRRPGQRRDPRRRRRPALRHGGRGWQPRAHPAGARRGGVERRADQYGRHRQCGRRGLLGPRGQHQDPDRRAGHRGRPHRQTAQRAAGVDDRRGGRAGAGGQPRPDTGAVHRPPSGRADGGRARPLPAFARSGGPAQPGARVPAHRQAVGRAGQCRPGPDHARVRGAPRLHEGHQHRRRAGFRPA